MKSTKNKSKIPKITICPKCRSPKVRKEINILLAIGAPQQWLCENCGFKGHLFPQLQKLNPKRKK